MLPEPNNILSFWHDFQIEIAFASPFCFYTYQKFTPKTQQFLLFATDFIRRYKYLIPVASFFKANK